MSQTVFFNTAMTSKYMSGHLLLGVVRQAGAGSKDRSVVLDSEMLKFGPESLLFL